MNIYLGGPWEPEERDWRRQMTRDVRRCGKEIIGYLMPERESTVVQLRRGLDTADYIIFRFTRSSVAERPIMWTALTATMAPLKPGRVIISLAAGIAPPLMRDLTDLAALVADSGGMWLPGDMQTLMEVISEGRYPDVKRAGVEA